MCESVSENYDFISGHGVSYLIRTDSATILLDISNNPDGLTVAPFVSTLVLATTSPLTMSVSSGLNTPLRVYIGENHETPTFTI